MELKTQERFYKKYPKLFKQKNYTIQESCLAWGICCGEGWSNLLDCMCAEIEIYQRNMKILKEPLEPVEFTQIKEKYGLLRIYYQGGNDMVADIINRAEQESAITCEECGSKEKVKQSKGWIYTECKLCRNKRLKNE